MKTLKAQIYKHMLSILTSDNKYFKSAQNITTISMILTHYPSKTNEYQSVYRLLHYMERNIHSVSFIVELMRSEGEDEEIVSTIEFMCKNQSLKTGAEVNRFCVMLSDYIKYHKIMKAKGSFMSSLDMIDDESDIKNNIETLYKAATDIVQSYNSVNVNMAESSFDTKHIEGMKLTMATTIDSKKPNKIILTGIRGLNSMLSPGYLPELVYVYVGLPGNYKSGILLESHVSTCKYNPQLAANSTKTPISMYISMENTMTQTIRRLWSLLYPNADITCFSVDESTEMINNALTSTGVRSVILYYGYREKSTYDVSNIIVSYNDDENEVVALYLDYIKRIRPGRTDAAAVSSEKSELNVIMNELKYIAAQHHITIVTGHQLNRAAAAAVDSVVSSGGYNKTDTALSRSNVGTAWEVMEVADFIGLINIENNGETKQLVIKNGKRRDIDPNETDASIDAIRHPFISPQSFALVPDINETYSMSTPVYIGKHACNYMASI